MPCLLAHFHLQNQQQLARSFLYHITQSLTLSPHSFTFEDPYYLLGDLLFSESVLGDTLCSETESVSASNAFYTGSLRKSHKLVA